MSRKARFSAVIAAVAICFIFVLVFALGTFSPDKQNAQVTDATPGQTPVAELSHKTATTAQAAADAPADSTASTAAEPDIITDEATGSQYAARSLILTVSRSASQEDVLAALEQAGATGVTLSMVADTILDDQLVILADYTSDADPVAVASALSGAGAFVSAEPDYVQTLCEVGEAEVLDDASLGALEESDAELLTTSVNDAYVSRQWGLTSASAFDAWDTAKASGSVTVAVIDSGVDTDHTDLDGNLILGNYAKNTYTNTTGTAAVEDEIGHGTHVSGIIAAEANNSVGVAGVSYNAKVLPVKATCDSEGHLYDSDLIEAIDYVVKLKTSSSSPDYLKNIRVINMSLGGYDSSTTYQNAVTAATNVGILVVAAAGNEATSELSYPASYENVVSVSALRSSSNGIGTFDDEYSNYGSTVDIAAPGSSIASTYLNGRYASMSGTSMATPMVAGVAALLFSENMSATPATVEAALEGSARDAGDTGRDDYYGYGILNAQYAVQWMAGTQEQAPAPTISLTSGWAQWGNCEWMLVDTTLGTNTLYIRPLGNDFRGTTGAVSSAGKAPWYSRYRTSIEHIYISSGVTADEACCNLFAGCSNATTIDISNLLFDSDTNLEDMFTGCAHLEELTLALGADYRGASLRDSAWTDENGYSYDSTAEMLQANYNRITADNGLLIGDTNTYTVVHSYSEPVITFSDDGTTATATWPCADTDYPELSKTAECTVTSTTVEPTCTEAGKTIYTATVAADEEQDLAGGTATKEVAIPALGHSCSGDYEIDVPATATTDGSRHYTCTRCGVEVSETIAAGESPYADLDSAVVVSQNALLDGTAGLCVTIAVPDAVLQLEGAFVEFVDGEGTIGGKILLSAGTAAGIYNGLSTYSFVGLTTYLELADAAYVRVVSGDGWALNLVDASGTDCIETGCPVSIASSYDATVAATSASSDMLASMIIFGTRCQTWFEHNASYPGTSYLAEDVVKKLNDVADALTADMIADSKPASTDTSSVTCVGANIAFGSTLELLAYFEIDAGDVDDYVFTIGGDTAKVTEVDPYWTGADTTKTYVCVRSAGVKASDYSVAQTFVVTDATSGTVASTLQYSVYGYIWACLSQTDTPTAFLDVCRSLYVYGNYAQLYALSSASVRA